MVELATVKLVFVLIVAAAYMSGPGGGLVGADLAGCKAKCTGDYKYACDDGCTWMLGSFTTKSACDSHCGNIYITTMGYANSLTLYNWVRHSNRVSSVCV